MRNPIDRLVAFVSPQAGLKRAHARKVLAKYEGGEPSRLRKFRTGRSNQNETVQRYGRAVTEQVRYLCRNHDLARGALRTLVNNVAGPNGVGIEPQPRRADGSIHKEYAADLRELYKDWSRHPEVTHRLSMSAMQRACVRSWLRDGEIFAQLIMGTRGDLDHGTVVPFSLELFETDMVPMDTYENLRIVQGIERNTWGRPVALHVYKQEPWRLRSSLNVETKRIPWATVLHLASLDHIGQVRGVSEFASVITRLEDIKDYEESERVAAKVAAMLTAYVKKGNADAYELNEENEPRELSFEPATIIDDLGPGEEIGVIDSNRPNTNLVAFRQGQLRATAAGIGASYSSVSRDYGGTYSSQRQELVEQWTNYAALVDDFTSAFLRPVWETFVNVSRLSGALPTPADVVDMTSADALFIAQSMPWIDPLKEALGYEALVKAGFASELEIIRKRGGNPYELLDQIESWRKECEDRGIVFSSNEAALAAASMAVSGEPADGAE